MKILIAEDSEMTSKLLEARFKKAGFDVVCAYDGEEALRMIKKEKIDIIVSDLNMPKLDGFALAKLVRIKDEETPFLVYTSQGGTADLALLAKRLKVDFIESSNLENILIEVLGKFDRAIRENKLKHEGL